MERSRGISQLGLLFFSLIAAAFLFAAYQIMPFYYGYFELQGQLQALAKKGSVLNDKEIRIRIWQVINEQQIPIESDEEIKINRTGGKIIIDIEYSEVFYVDLGDERVYDLWVFDFNPHAEEKL